MVARLGGLGTIRADDLEHWSIKLDVHSKRVFYGLKRRQGFMYLLEGNGNSGE